MPSRNQTKQWVEVGALVGTVLLVSAITTSCQGQSQVETTESREKWTKEALPVSQEFNVSQTQPLKRLEKTQAKALGRNFGNVLAIRYSPKGDYLAIYTEPDKTVRIWNIQGQKIGELKAGDLGGFETGYALQFSPQGDRLLTFVPPKPTHKDKFEVKIWNLQGKPVATLPQAWWNPAWNPSSKYYAATSDKPGLIRVWDFNGQAIATLKALAAPKKPIPINQVRISPSGNYVLTTSNTAGSTLWNLSGKQLAQLPDLKFQAIYFSQDEQRLIALDEATTVTQWNLQGQKVASIEIEPFKTKTAVSSLPLKRSTFSPQTEQFVMTVPDFMFVWDLQGNQTASFVGSSGWFKFPMGTVEDRAILESAMGNRVVTQGNDGKSRLWDLKGAFLAEGESYRAALSPDGKRIVLVSKSDNIARIWQID